jgi:hypothetical protein
MSISGGESIVPKSSSTKRPSRTSPDSRLSLREGACFRGAKDDIEMPRASTTATLNWNLVLNHGAVETGVIREPDAE